MFCVLLSYPQLWIELLTTFYSEESKDSYCQVVFSKVIKNKIKFIPVEKIEDVLKNALVGEDKNGN